MSKLIQEIEKEQMLTEGIPEFHIGDTVKVHVKISEGGKERVQIFTGTVIARDAGAAGGTFTVRRVSHGVGVERVFPIHSPHIAKLEVASSARVRRAKLYFLRDRVGKKTRLREKIRR